MTTTVVHELQKDRLRARLTVYLRKAFQILPELNKPTILDIGCGTGIPTMELARLSNGRVTGLDISQPLLDELMKKIDAAALSDRVNAVKGSLFAMAFPDERFDILWSEGSIGVIGFERGLKEWRRLLRPGGFLVVHDEIANISHKRTQIAKCGYELLGWFSVDADIWWREFYGPLERRIQKLRKKYSDDPEPLAVLNKEQREVDLFKKNPYGSVFFIMQKATACR